MNCAKSSGVPPAGSMPALTNRSWATDPYGSPTKERPNPVYERDAIFNFTEVQVDRRLEEQEVREIFAAEIAKILKPVAQPLALSERRPHVVLVVGVNGSGKTTTIGKLAQSYKRAGKSVMLAAGGALYKVDLATGKARMAGRIEGLSGALSDIAWID